MTMETYIYIFRLEGQNKRKLPSPSDAENRRRVGVCQGARVIFPGSMLVGGMVPRLGIMIPILSQLSILEYKMSLFYHIMQSLFLIKQLISQLLYSHYITSHQWQNHFTCIYIYIYLYIYHISDNFPIIMPLCYHYTIWLNYDNKST